MPLNPILLVTATALEIAGTVGLLLTHFGFVPGFRVISPVLFALGFTAYLAGIGLIGHPLFLFGFFAVATIFLELVFQFNLLGLGSIAFLGGFGSLP